MTDAFISGNRNLEEFVTKEQYDVIVQKLGIMEQAIVILKEGMIELKKNTAVMQSQLNDIKHFMVVFFIGNLSVTLAVLGLGAALFLK